MKTFYEAIYEWVADNFDGREADRHGHYIESLADYLSKTDIKPDELSAYTKSNVYSALDQSYVEEDVEYYAKEVKNIDLTEQQVRNVADKIRNSDWYSSINAGDMDWYINQELRREER